MQIIENTLDIQIDEQTVVSIGKFDGIHKGHMDLFQHMKEYGEKGYKTCVVTFSVQPEMVVAGSNQTGLLTTSFEKRQIFTEMGIDYYVELPFGPELMHMPAEQFLNEILLKQMNMQVIVAGDDCRFGYRGQGNLTFLKEQEKSDRFSVCAIEKKTYKNREISSTYVREEVEAGHMEEAGNMLARPYSFYALDIKIMGDLLLLKPGHDKLLPPVGKYTSKLLGCRGNGVAELFVREDRNVAILIPEGENINDIIYNNKWYCIC